QLRDDPDVPRPQVRRPGHFLGRQAQRRLLPLRRRGGGGALVRDREQPVRLGRRRRVARQLGERRQYRRLLLLAQVAGEQPARLLEAAELAVLDGELPDPVDRAPPERAVLLPAQRRQRRRLDRKVLGVLVGQLDPA